jgi:hypothetical protein
MQAFEEETEEMRWVAERVSRAAAETPSEAWRANKQIEAALVRF